MSGWNALKLILEKVNADIKAVEEYLSPDDPEATTLLVGSTNEGFGNSTSDIDILIVYPKDRFIDGWSANREGTVLEIDPLKRGGTSVRRPQELLILSPVKGAKLQISIVGEEGITWIQDQIIGRLESIKNRISGGPKEIKRKGVTLTLDDLKILHRFYSGTVIHNNSRTQEIRSRLSEQQFADYSLTLRTHDVLGSIEDLVGFFDQNPEGEEETKLYLLQEILLTLANAVLAAVGELNVGEKFQFRLLKRHQDKIGRDISQQIISAYRNLFNNSEIRLESFFETIDASFDRLAEISPLFASDIKARNYRAVSGRIKVA